MTDAAAAAIRAALTDALLELSEPRLRAAAGHLLGRGKLFRPALALATLEALGESDPSRWAALVAPLELLHTFTLIHDDLPCMDDAQLRRGVPAVHLEFDEALAVLAGDALCSLAFHMLALAPGEATAAQRLALVETLSRATNTVVAGQVLDMGAEGRELSVEELSSLHAAKTGALLGACCQFGAILHGADSARQAQLREVGEGIGLLFQIRDDLLSVESTEAAAGKTLTTDAERGKNTFVSRLGAAATRQAGSRLLAELEARIAALDLARPEVLLEMARQAFARQS